MRVFLARFGGFPCFVFCGDPRYGGGALGTKSCEKLMRAIGIAGTFHLPIVNFVDWSVRIQEARSLCLCPLSDYSSCAFSASLFSSPGFSVGSIAEKTGTIRAGARLTNAAFDSRVPWFCCVGALFESLLHEPISNLPSRASFADNSHDPRVLSPPLIWRRWRYPRRSRRRRRRSNQRSRRLAQRRMGLPTPRRRGRGRFQRTLGGDQRSQGERGGEGKDIEADCGDFEPVEVGRGV